MPNLCESSLENQNLSSNKNSIDSDHLSNNSQNAAVTPSTSDAKIHREHDELASPSKSASASLLSHNNANNAEVESKIDVDDDTTVKCVKNGADSRCDNENEIVVISEHSCCDTSNSNCNSPSGNHEEVQTGAGVVSVRKPPTKASMLDPFFFCCFLNEIGRAHV